MVLCSYMGNAILYLRYSTVEQADGQSEQRPTRGAERWCKEHGEKFIKIYKDLGVYHVALTRKNRLVVMVPYVPGLAGIQFTKSTLDSRMIFTGPPESAGRTTPV